MRRMAHIINPVKTAETSDLFVAQPITFQSLAEAQAYARGRVDVELFSAHFAEDDGFAPVCFQRTSHLTRSVLDFGEFERPRKLPLLKDILDRLYEATQAEYLIYTNADIAALPFFYLTIDRLIEQGYDAFTINRRTISKEFTQVVDIPLMAAQVGEAHPGLDCFVFRREVYPQYVLGNACIGAFHIGRILAINLIFNARRYHEFGDLHITYHLGNDQSWKAEDLLAYMEYNGKELDKVLAHYPVLESNYDYPFLRHMRRMVTPAPENVEPTPAPAKVTASRSFLRKIARLLREIAGRLEYRAVQQKTP